MKTHYGTFHKTDLDVMDATTRSEYVSEIKDKFSQRFPASSGGILAYEPKSDDHFDENVSSQNQQFAVTNNSERKAS